MAGELQEVPENAPQTGKGWSGRTWTLFGLGMAALAVVAFAVTVLALSAYSPLGGAQSQPIPTAYVALAPAPTVTSSPAPTATAVPTKTPTPRPTKTPTPRPTARPKATPATALSTPSARLASIMAKAAAVRSLPPAEEVPVRYLSREEVGPYMRNLYEEEYSQEDAAKDEALFVLLGLLDEGDDLYESYLALLGEQVVGFYEFDSHDMKLVGEKGSPTTMEELTLVHEYVHALQDQHFDMGAMAKEVEGNGERGLALQALAEGDATLSMVAYAMQNLSRDEMAALQEQSGTFDSQQLNSAPPALRSTLLFPYLQGVTFVGALFQAGGWNAVDDAYRHPPQTSEQILHPEKYLRGEGPEEVDLPDLGAALGSPWSVVDRDTFGELGLQMYLQDGVQAKTATAAAAGWGGDSYVLLSDAAGRYALASLSAWDSVKDATEFFTALRSLGGTGGADDTHLTWSAPGKHGYASMQGDKVLLVIAPDEATTTKIAGAFAGF
ncbi:MAG: hypothetical protein ACYC1C_15470 [Chloroflexota bacterium]